MKKIVQIKKPHDLEDATNIKLGGGFCCFGSRQRPCARLRTAFQIVSLLALSTLTARAGEPDYKALFERANSSASLWKDKALSLEKENSALREQISKLTTKVSSPTPAPLVEAVQEVQKPPEDKYVEVPNYGANQLDQFGGPRVKVNFYLVNLSGALIQVGSSAKRAVEVGTTGMIMIYKDSITGEEVYYTNKIASKSGHVVLMIRTFPR
jgi:hypothetical protein